MIASTSFESTEDAEENNQKADRMLTPKDIQSIFGISRVQAYALVSSEGFPSFRINKRFFIAPNMLDEWIKKTTGKTYYI